MIRDDLSWLDDKKWVVVSKKEDSFSFIVYGAETIQECLDFMTITRRNFMESDIFYGDRFVKGYHYSGNQFDIIDLMQMEMYVRENPRIKKDI